MLHLHSVCRARVPVVHGLQEASSCCLITLFFTTACFKPDLPPACALVAPHIAMARAILDYDVRLVLICRRSCGFLLQSLSSSPYLDPRLFSYSKHISPIIGLRNSPSEPLHFRHARRYAALSSSGSLAADEGASQASASAADESASSSSKQRVLFQLEPAQPPSVVWGTEEVPRRQLHLFHPTDPFVLTVVQTIAQPAVVSICYRA
jgi:hypothetical protein